MSVSHEEIMAEIMVMKAQMVVKADLVPLQADVANIKETQVKMTDAVEIIAAVKTGSRFVVWMSKFTAGLIAIYIVGKGFAEFFVRFGNQ
jgi:hypothetical protein